MTWLLSGVALVGLLIGGSEWAIARNLRAYELGRKDERALVEYETKLLRERYPKGYCQ